MKHLFTLLTCILFNHFVYAQLSVRNDHYVFLNDEIVFVEDDINLNEANSRIYLRSESQIIQGSGTSGNSGIGELSVYQEANVGEYEYNYWCSPIGNKTNNNINNAFGVTFLNDVIGLTTSTPATIAHVTGYNSTSSPLTIEPYWIWKFIASDEYSDWIHAQGNTSINPGEGFTMKGTSGSSDAQRYDFRGKPNNGTIGVNVLNSQFTLVGNPYPSAIDALEYIHDTENAAVITGTLYFWEQDPTVNSHYLRDYDGGYASYTISAGGVETYTPATFSTYNGDGTINGGSGGSPSGKRPRRYIPIGQGFMVEGTATGTVKAKNSHRVYEVESGSDSEFFKTTNQKHKASETNNSYSFVPDDYKRFRLNIDFNNNYTRQLVETFHSSASLGFDYGLESIMLDEDSLLDSDAYFSNNNSTYIAEALNYSEELKIPLVIIIAENNSVRFRIADVQNFNSNQPIYLHDIENNLFVDLNTQDYDINLDKGEYTKRFEITFNKNTLNIDDITFTDFNVFQINKSSKLKILNPETLNIKSLNLFDISGKLVLDKSINTNKKSYTFSTKTLSDGIYVVKVNTNSNKTFSKKIVINNIK